MLIKNEVNLTERQRERGEVLMKVGLWDFSFMRSCGRFVALKESSVKAGPSQISPDLMLCGNYAI